MGTPRSRDNSSALLLLAAVVVAMVWANSPWRASYVSFWALRFGARSLRLDLRAWVNDGLMAIFFFVAGLEIKRALVRGHLNTVRKAVFPVAAAIGGMVVSAGIYAAVNAGRAGAHGWGIPMATDIAFALGALALAGPRIPEQVRLLLLTIAVADDIGTIVIIAVFYGGTIHWLSVGVTFGFVGLVVALRFLRVRWLAAYALAGLGLWIAMYQAGINAAISGVVLGLLTPAASLHWHPEPPTDRVQNMIDPWSSYAILPVFALTNAGLSLGGSTSFGSRVVLGVVVGRVLGKMIGISLFAWAAERAGAHRPAGVGWRHVVGVGALGGIGFTVALFIASASFGPGTLGAQAKLGLFAASVISALFGAAILRGSKEKV